MQNLGYLRISNAKSRLSGDFKCKISVIWGFRVNHDVRPNIMRITCMAVVLQLYGLICANKHMIYQLYAIIRTNI